MLGWRQKDRFLFEAEGPLILLDSQTGQPAQNKWFQEEADHYEQR